MKLKYGLNSTTINRIFEFFTMYCIVAMTVPFMAAREIGGGYLNRGIYYEPDWRPIIIVFTRILAGLLCVQACYLLKRRRSA